MNNQTIAFIGAGNMTRSLIGGLIADGYDAQKLWVSNPSMEKLQQLQQLFGVRITQDNNEVVQQADVVVLAVKPHHMKGVMEQLAASIHQHQPLVISVAAGILKQTLQQWLGWSCPLVRAMPNTPVFVGSGATGLYASPQVTAEQKDIAESIMRAVGIIVWLDEEEQLDIVTALSGCGPAYYFLIMEAMEQAAQDMGLAPAAAHLLSVQTALGAAQMALKAEVGCAQLRKNVMSPGGVTEQAVKVLEQRGIREIMSAVLQAAQDKAVSIAAEHRED